MGYFRGLRPGREVVLMGHSTGCQDVMEYVVGEGECEFSFHCELRVEASSKVATSCDQVRWCGCLPLHSA